MKKESKEEIITSKEEASSYDFVKEKIKDRPINRKKLTRKLIFTASMAVLFGSIACLSFYLLTPVFEKYVAHSDKDEEVPPHVVLEETINDQEQIEVNAVISDTPFDEGQDQNIYATETPIENLNYNDAVSENSVSNNVVVNTVTVQFELDDYQTLYRKMYSLSNEVSKSTVVVTGIKKGQDIFNEEYVNTNKTTGLIIAEDGSRLYILADGTEVPNENNTVTFNNGYIASVEDIAIDKDTGLGIYTVYIPTLPAEVKENYQVATLGSSKSTVLLGSPVIVVGDPLNTGNSICYGAVTSLDSKVYGLDSAYQLINTDVYASKKAKGIVVNVRGQVIGIVCQHNNSEELENLITAYGISEIKNLIEDLSNVSERPYLGLYVKDISEEARKSYKIPQGIYVSKVEIDSPAMKVGIGSGDIVCSINDREINSVSEYMNILRTIDINQVAEIGVMRLNGEDYYRTDISVKVEGREGDKK